MSRINITKKIYCSVYGVVKKFYLFLLRWSHKNIKPLSDGVVKKFYLFLLRWSHKNIKPLSDGVVKKFYLFLSSMVSQKY
ncbi:hypothetical protein [Vaccinia virus]|nr:hypothetical protein [Vaccinia virus]AXN56291.1 hypothetical protein [Vaccinia virus]AXN56532.1 hypothetical protein [Vaccinia virus]